MNRHTLRTRLAGAATLGVVAVAATLVIGPTVASAAPADPPGGATPVYPHFFNGNVTGIRDSGSDTTFFMMQKIGDLYTGAGLYGCTLAQSGDTPYNTTDGSPTVSSTQSNFFCKAGANVDTTDVNDNWNRVEITEGVDAVGSGAGQNQLCGTMNTPLTVDFARSSKPEGSCGSPNAFVETGYGKDAVPAVTWQSLIPAFYGASTSSVNGYGNINGGLLGAVPDGWLPGNNLLCGTGGQRIGSVTISGSSATITGNFPGDIQAGDNVSDSALGSGVIPSGDTVQSVSGSTVTLTTGATGAASGDILIFSSPSSCSGTKLGNISNNDNGGSTSSTAYSIWCGGNISDWGQLTNLGPNVVEDNVTETGTNSVSLASGTFLTAIVNGDAVTGTNIQPGTTVTGGGGTGTLTLSSSTTGSSTSATLTITIAAAQPVGQGQTIGYPIRPMGVNTSSGTEATFTSFANSGNSNTGCSSNMNTFSPGDPNPATAPTPNSAHVALENNATQVGQFASGDWPNPDFVDQAIEVSQTIYMESRGVNNTDPFAGATTINGASYSVTQLNENNTVGAASAANIEKNTYPTARTLFNIYDTATVKGSVGGLLNWICDQNQAFQKGQDNSTGVNFDTELTTTIQNTFGFIRLSDVPVAIEETANPTPADNISSGGINNTCGLSETVSTTASNNTVTLTSGTWPSAVQTLLTAGVPIPVYAFGTTTSGLIPTNTTVSSVSGATLTMSNNASATNASVTLMLGMPPVTSVAVPQS